MFDVVVIGGGPGGYKAAELLGAAGKKTALIEKEYLGGVCLNQGCIPFKSYLHVSKVYKDVKGLVSSGLLNGDFCQDINQKNVYQNKLKTLEGLRKGVESTLLACNVSIYNGEGKLLGNDGGVARIEVNGEILESKNVVIATGSGERTFDIPADLNYSVIGSKDLLELTEIPESIDIIGAGAIGLEAASYFKEAGSKVTIIEAQDHIGGHIDLEISQALERIFSKRGMKIHTSTSFVSFEKNEVVYEHNGEKFTSQPKVVLVAVGRKPVFDKSALDICKVEYSDKGILVDEHCRTNVPNIYACGDATGILMLAHTAYHQARVISDTLCGKDNKTNYEVIPQIIYSSPEVFTIGQMMGDGDTVCKSLPMTFSGKYFAENGKDGAKAKMAVDKDGRIVGFSMIADGCSEISLAAELMVAGKMKISEVANLVYPHPTYGEIIGELASQF